MFLPSTMTLKFGDSGDFVSELQRRLAIAGCFSDSMVSGFFDGSTVNGVMAFQSRHALHADGVAGPETLRRLNGIISGDTSSSAPADTAEEEKPAAVAPPVQQFVWGAAPVAANPFVDRTGVETVAEAVRSEPRPVEPAPSQPSSYDALAALVQSAPPPVQREPVQQHPEVIPISERPPLTSPTAPMPPTAQVEATLPQQTAMQLPTTPQYLTNTMPPQQLSVEPTQAAPQGIVGRAVQFASAMMQRLADYFEAKLPPSVLHEVHAIGQQMAREGVREVPIPQAPEPVRAVEQGRGVEHGQQRG